MPDEEASVPPWSLLLPVCGLKIMRMNSKARAKSVGNQAEGAFPTLDLLFESEIGLMLRFPAAGGPRSSDDAELSKFGEQIQEVLGDVS